MSLIRWQGQDTRNIVIMHRVFFFGKIADYMTARGVSRCHHIKQKGFDVKVQSFVIQEELGQQTQALTILKKIVNKYISK